MLTHLHIRDFAIIDDTEVEPGTGLTALTGETGAGKSILLDALSLVLGERARASAVNDKATRAEVTASFDLADDSTAAQWLHEHDLNVEDGECVIRRVVLKTGKSRASVNGSPVPVASLKALGARLVSIHGQSAHHSLSQAGEQRRLLDAINPHAAMDATAKAWDALQQARKRLQDAEDAANARQQRHDLLAFQLQEFDDADLHGLTPEAIEQEHRWLAAAERSREAGSAIEQSLDSVATPAINDALRPLRELAALDSSLQEALDLVESASIQISEAVRLIVTRTASLESDERRLAWLDERLSVLHAIAKKHRVDIVDIAAVEDRLRAEFDALDNPEESIEALSEQRDAAHKTWLKQALLLSRHRKRAAKKLADTITAAMQTLAMEGGVFQVRVDADETRTERHGIDSVTFEVSPNPGVAPAPLAQVASGGELSRIGLALQLATQAQQAVPTLIFDEVDAGIGGAVGETVGKLLRQLGTGFQVLCVTHLPQVAAQAHAHLRVTKSVEDGQTVTRLSALDRKQTRDEIARMLGGKTITAKTRQHAAEMLDSVV